MGSMIQLSVGNLEIDWGKNNGFIDHSPIFQPTDLAKVPYYYVDDENPQKNDGSGDYNLVTELKDGMSKPLSEVVERIRLLGYSFEYARKEFEFVAELGEIDTSELNFDYLSETFRNVDVTMISSDCNQGETFGKFFKRGILKDDGQKDVFDELMYCRFHMGEAMEHFSAYSILHLLSLNPLANSIPVSWQFADVEEGGWAGRNTFVRDLDPVNKFLIVTEGSSDANILKHAFKLLKPHIADFFTFVDMNEGYPFSGTGNLHNFTKGLISIAVQNDIVILYDNDAEGVASYNKTRKLNLPSNMKVLKLPDLPSFKYFKTIGPDGEGVGDINGSGAAIECYLDVGSEATVRWNNYNKDIELYHGEIFEKRTHMMNFLMVKDLNTNYDFSKISAVLNMIVEECASLRAVKNISDLEKNAWQLQ